MSEIIPKKFIIDLDTGVDDAMALLIALHAHKKGDIKIMAITGVSGNTSQDNVIRNTYRTLEVANCTDIPVHRGLDSQMVVQCDTGNYSFHGKDGFNDISFDWQPDVSKVSKEPAISAIQRLVKTYPNEITIVALGPLTNIALAFKTDKEFADNVKEIFIMGGNIEGTGNISIAAEFNFHVDPEAAYVVLNSTKCPTYIITWEMCFKYVKPSMEWRKSVLGKMITPEAKLMNVLEQVWFDDYEFDSDHWIMCDQFAMIAALDRSSIIKCRKERATVELSGQLSRGGMFLEQRSFVKKGSNYYPNVIIVDDMDHDKIKEHLLNAFGRC